MTKPHDPSGETPPRMRLYKILNGFVPTMRNAPCRIAIYTDGHTIKVYERVYNADFHSPYPQRWERHYHLESFGTPQAVEKRLRDDELLKENDNE